MRTTKPGLFEAGPALEAVAIADGVAQAGQWGRHADRADLPLALEDARPFGRSRDPIHRLSPGHFITATPSLTNYRLRLSHIGGTFPRYGFCVDKKQTLHRSRNDQ